MFEIAFSVEPFAGVWRVLATVSVWGFGIEFRPLRQGLPAKSLGREVARRAGARRHRVNFRGAAEIQEQEARFFRGANDQEIVGLDVPVSEISREQELAGPQ